MNNETHRLVPKGLIEDRLKAIGKYSDFVAAMDGTLLATRERWLKSSAFDSVDEDIRTLITSICADADVLMSTD